MRTLQTIALPLLSASALVAQQPSWPYSMDFGPCLMTTFAGGGMCGDVEKGLVVRLGDGVDSGADAILATSDAMQRW